MAFIALIIGAILVVAAIRDTQGDLFTALGTDVPAFVTWAAAIVALGAIGFIPNLKPLSRALLALVLVVIFLRNYKQILAGFQSGITSATGSGNKASGSGSGGPPMRGKVTVSDASDASSVLSNVNAEINGFSSGLGLVG